MAAHNTPVFTAIATSSRQLLLLLRCISFAKKSLVRLSPEGLRFTTSTGSTLEAFVFLEKSLFTSYTYRAQASTSSQDDPSDPPTFEVDLESLLETLNIFSLSEPFSSSKRPGGGAGGGPSSSSYSDFAAHRLSRHAGINAFSSHAAGLTGTCTFTYHSPGSPLSIHMSESGVTTTCDLTTYEAPSTEEIPFDRSTVALKTILRSTYLLDAVNELSSLNPSAITLTASPAGKSANLSLSATGALGDAAMDFTTSTASETPVLETFTCPTRVSETYGFTGFKAAQRAMSSAAKVSVRVDGEGVLSLQFLVEIESAYGVGLPSGGGQGSESDGQGGKVAFVDFRIVPLVDDDGRGAEEESSDED